MKLPNFSQACFVPTQLAEAFDSFVGPKKTKIESKRTLTKIKIACLKPYILHDELFWQTIF